MDNAPTIPSEITMFVLMANVTMQVSTHMPTSVTGEAARIHHARVEPPVYAIDDDAHGATSRARAPFWARCIG